MPLSASGPILEFRIDLQNDVVLVERVYIVETMRWPNASSSVLSMVEGRMPKLDATSRLIVMSSTARHSPGRW